MLFSGVLEVIPLCDYYRGRAGPNVYVYIYIQETHEDRLNTSALAGLGSFLL